MKKNSTKRNTLAVAIYDNMLGYEYSIVAELFGLVRPGTDAFWYDFRTCRVEPGELTTSHGMTIRPKYGLAELQRAQTVVVPGWRNVDERPRPAFLRGLQAAYRNGARIISVCTGAFVLAHAGLLDGRRATTHWLFADKFREQFPQVELLDDSLYVHDGHISTSAGSSAGLDLCLSVIRNDFGAEVAKMVARRMVAPVHREGGQSQYAVTAILDTDDADFGPILDWMIRNLAEPLTIEHIADKFAISLRTFQRRFRALTGIPPLLWISQKRVELARNLLEVTDLSIDQIAWQSGLGSSANLRKHFARHLHTTPSTYRGAFKSEIGGQ